MKSSFLRLNWFDLAKGLVVAIVAPALVVIQSVWSSGVLNLDLKQLLSVGLAGGLAYLIENLFTDNKPKEININAITDPVRNGGKKRVE